MLVPVPPPGNRWFCDASLTGSYNSGAVQGHYTLDIVDSANPANTYEATAPMDNTLHKASWPGFPPGNYIATLILPRVERGCYGGSAGRVDSTFGTVMTLDVYAKP
jgi:hypothetical protein